MLNTNMSLATLPLLVMMLFGLAPWVIYYAMSGVGVLLAVMVEVLIMFLIVLEIMQLGCGDYECVGLCDVMVSFVKMVGMGGAFCLLFSEYRKFRRQPMNRAIGLWSICLASVGFISVVLVEYLW